MKKNYYELLGINQDAQVEEIKKAAYHQLNEVTQALKVLSDTDKRQAYDLTLQTTQPPTNNYYDLLSINQTTATAIIQPAALAQLDEIKVALGVLSNMEKRQAYDLTLQPTPPLEERSPYHPPATLINDTSDEKDDLENDNLEFELASRARRLSAVTINFIIYIIIMGLSLYLTIEFTHFMRGLYDNKLLPIVFILFHLSFVVIIAIINLILLYHHGQTIGKRLLSIKIVRSDGSCASLKRIVLLRFLLLWLIILDASVFTFGPHGDFKLSIDLSNTQMITNILGLIDLLFLFRRDRRCLHDLIADTIVIKQP